jgi:uncharacterized spore protein YtfJ
MSEEFDKVVATTERSQDTAAEVVEKLFDVAQPSSVYSEPIIAGDHTLITASEVSIGMGFGLGVGGGEGRGGPRRAADEDEAVEEDESEMQGEGVGLGGGGGGGGAAMARPVAVISVGPNGVQVEPVVDPTKIAIAFFTTLGSMFFMLSRMRRR